MSIATHEDVVGQIEREAIGRRKAADAEYWRLAGIIARKQKTPADVHGILHAAGKSTDDLRSDVSAIEKRLILAAQITAAAVMTSERPALAKKHDDALKAFEVAQAKFQLIRDEVLPVIAGIEAAEFESERNRETLAEKCPYGNITDPLAEVREKIVLLGVRRGSLERLLDSHRRELIEIGNYRPNVYGNLADPMNRPPAPFKPERVAELKAEIESGEKELATILAELVPLAKEESRLIALTLEP